MLTTDISGTYDYEKEEAFMVAGYYLELIEEANSDTTEIERIVQKIVKEGVHWNKALGGGESFADFVRWFNAKMPSDKFHIKA